MNRFEERIQNKSANASDLLVELDKTASWQDAYWIGKCLYDLSDSKYDRSTLEAFEKAFDIGLNVHSAQSEFFEATQIAAKLYFNYGAYEPAINKLMLLVDNNEDVPDWIHLFYATAQIHTDNLFRIAADPAFFFARLDRIDSGSVKEASRRDSIYKEFLTLITDKLMEGAKISVADSTIIEKAVDYNLSATLEFQQFRSIFDSGTPIVKPQAPALPETITLDIDAEKLDELNQQITRLENEQSRLLALIAESEAKIASLEGLTFAKKSQAEEIAQIRREIEDINRPKIKNQEKSESPSQKAVGINGHDLLRRNQKLLVIGGTKVKARVFIGIANSDFGLENGDLETVLEYDKIKSYVSRILPYSSAYAGIIVGPCPHKAVDSGDYSSFIQKIREEEGYPHIEEARDESGQLKITKNSFRQALNRMVTHLGSIT